eukprot:tig00020902_g15018.t1
MQLSEKESLALVRGLKDPSPLLRDGIYADGARYACLRADPEAPTVMGRCGTSTLLATSTLLQKHKGTATIVVVTKDGADPRNVIVHEQIALALGMRGFRLDEEGQGRPEDVFESEGGADPGLGLLAELELELELGGLPLPAEELEGSLTAGAAGAAGAAEEEGADWDAAAADSAELSLL